MQLTNNCELVSMQIDMKGCAHEIIVSAAAIQDYVIQLCRRICIERVGDIRILNIEENDGMDGHTFIQPIKKHLITGNFDNETDSAYIDIFANKTFHYPDISDFTKEFFNAIECEYKINLRK